jgi:aspartyl/asparaginyl-tRNA synthetase
MIKDKISKVGLIVLFSSLMLFSCNGFFTAPINKILTNPRAYARKTVKVSGEVTQIFGVLVIKYFKVRDGTGEIIVVTEKPLHKIGTKIKVKGTVEEAFSIGDQQLIVIVKKDET